VPPIIAKEDAAGVVAGTTSHFSKAFPQVKVELEGGQIVKVHGGAAYGDAWRTLLDESRNTKYPCFHGQDYFTSGKWLSGPILRSCAERYRKAFLRRLRVGAAPLRRDPHGLRHAVAFPMKKNGPARTAFSTAICISTYSSRPSTSRPRAARNTPIIRNGRLTALDDPEVRKLAEKYGDPDDLLREDWVPQIPGISSAGSYDDYAREPGSGSTRKARDPVRGSCSSREFCLALMKPSLQLRQDHNL